MIAPVFVGFCFCGRDIGNYRWLLLSIRVIFYIVHRESSPPAYTASALGRFFPYSRLDPRVRRGVCWWSQADQLAGFAADGTFWLLSSCSSRSMLTSIRRSAWWCLFWAPVGMYAIKLTTSKTTMGLLAIYMVCLLLIRLLPEGLKFPALRRMALLSFLTILVPIILMILFLRRRSPANLPIALQHAGSHQQQLAIAVHIYEPSDAAGFRHRMRHRLLQLSATAVLRCRPATYVPVDNFYIGTYLMFGPAFVAFMVCVFYAISKTTDIYKPDRPHCDEPLCDHGSRVWSGQRTVDRLALRSAKCFARRPPSNRCLSIRHPFRSIPRA